MSNRKRRILSVVNKDLLSIEKALVDNLNPHLNLVSKISGHILFSGGKRLRPLLMVLSARLCGYDIQDKFKYSTMFEYLHAATLLHDDIVDGADIRHDNVVANHLWDYPTVLLTGDFLLARSISIAAATGMCSIVEVIADIAEKMSQGEIRQLEKRMDFLMAENEYLEIISHKTAMMFSGACKTGALLAYADPSKIEALANYGYNLGMAFQMADDLLDYSRKSAYLGKKTGTDLREGKLTMPVIFSMRQVSKVKRKRMCSIASSGGFSKLDFDWFVGVLEESGGLEYTYKKALKYIKKAKEALVVFDKSILVYTLKNIAYYTLERND